MQRRHPTPTIKTDEFEADTGQNICIVVSDPTPSVCRTALILMPGPCNVQVSGYVLFRQLADEQEPDPTLTPFQAYHFRLRCARLIRPLDWSRAPDQHEWLGKNQ
jgi:hypothetical protein